MSGEQPQVRRLFSRRRLLGTAGGLGVAGAAAAVIGWETLGGSSADGSTPNVVVPFHGEHQAGIATPAQHYLHFASFDVTAEKRQEVADLLRAWTDAAERMTRGETAGDSSDEPLAPQFDTGEAVGLAAGSLTVTFGFGPRLFNNADGSDRFGLKAARPPALVDMPAFPRDALEAERTGGDICIQACADDPEVAFHAVRNLTRIGRGSVVMKWSQLGFSRTSSTSRAQDTPRNLMGFKDGTNNIRAEDTAAMSGSVWVNDSPAWMRGGSYLVARRIRMLIETWDRSSLLDQEATIGRTKVAGAPLGRADEFDGVDLNSSDIPGNAHIRLANPISNGEARLLRRGYSFTDGMDAYGELDAGLFFICFQRDPQSQFVAIQQNLAQNDALNEYIRHTGSGIFACPGGVQPGDWIGGALLS